ncbi:MAG: MFS transporter, partial [Brachybacterium sp.]
VLLLAMALIIGIADVVFTSGRQILLPRLVPIGQIRPLVGKVQSASQASTLAAPVVLTVLLSLFAAPMAWIGAAVSYLASIFAQSALRSADARERPDVPIRTLHAQMREGFSLIWYVPQLKMITAANMLMNSSSMVANTLLPVIALTTLRIPAAHFAALGSLGAVAGIAGAAMASGITSKLGLRWTRVGTSVCASIGIVIILLLVARPGFLPGPPLAWVGAQYTLTFLSTALALVAGSDLIARLVPRESLGVAAGAQRTLVMGAMPVAALAVGGLASVTTMSTAIGVWLALATLSLLPTSFLKELP